MGRLAPGGMTGLAAGRVALARRNPRPYQGPVAGYFASGVCPWKPPPFLSMVREMARLKVPVISVVIALLILYSAWKLVREATDVLLEAAPAHVDMDALLEDLNSIEGLDHVHDVHVWTLTSGFVALAAHGVIDDPAQHMRVLDEVRARMASRGVEHVTFQIELRTLYQLPSPG